MALGNGDTMKEEEMDIQDLVLKIVQDTPTMMTAQQLIESQKGERWIRVLLVDTDGKPVPVQYDHEGRLKMAMPERLDNSALASLENVGVTP